jgi:hypothetical protein
MLIERLIEESMFAKVMEDQSRYEQSISQMQIAGNQVTWDTQILKEGEDKYLGQYNQTLLGEGNKAIDRIA